MPATPIKKSDSGNSMDLVLLGKAPLFQDLPQAGLEEAAKLARAEQAGEGEFFFIQGDPAERIYVLAEGQVKLGQINADGQQVLMRVIGPGTLFGAVALAQVEEYPVTAEAAEAALALSWAKRDLMKLTAAYPQLALNAMKLMAGHVQEFQQRFRELATERVERRLARTLLRLASQNGRKVEEGVLIDLPLTRQDLAEMTGTTLFTVSRTLSAWEAQGLVVSGRERVVIRYPHGLVSIAEDLPTRK
jgi:CRP/FNR family transcriptional regulator, nitrogen oxide reductase regulator